MKHAKRYARMFLNKSGDAGAEKALTELAVVSQMCSKSREFQRLLESPAFTAKEREAGVKAVCEKAGISGGTASFIIFLAQEGATKGMDEVLRKAVAMFQEKRRSVKATVVSPTGLGPEYEARIKAALARVTGRDVSVEYANDPGLIGGVLVKVGSTMFDASIKGQLRLLKEELIKG